MTFVARRWLRFLGVLIIACAATSATAQGGVPWAFTPHVVVMGTRGDARIALVHDAVAYWNRVFAQLGSGFRLPEPVFDERELPEDARQAMIRLMLERAPYGAQTPPALQDLPRDLSIVLGADEFPSFTTPFFDNRSRRVVALRRMDTAPLNLPNVAQNVVVHELGHALGLGHNADASLLMCGRPAPCRPPDFASTRLHIFALSADERRQLAAMYPAALPPRRP